jgi:hypothetical protein
MERAAVPNSPSCCYVHIGIPRTGSTAIEKFLYENRQILLDRGILYPEVNLRGYGHHDLAYLLSGGYPEWAIPQPRNLDDLAADLCHASAAHSGDILISSENFYLFPAIVRLQELLTETGASSGRRVVIIVYVRRQDEAQESWYSQTVKAQGETCEIDESIDRWRYLWDYRARLAEWAAAFGAANLVVRPYETTQFRGGSLITDFLACIGVDPTGMDLPTEKENARLNTDLLEFQRLVNRLPLGSQQKRRFHRELTALSLRTSDSELFAPGGLLGTAEKSEICRFYEAGNAEVALTCLGREALFLDEPAAAVSHSVGLSLEKLIYIISWLMARGGQGE